jgi:hypothetical protein
MDELVLSQQPPLSLEAKKPERLLMALTTKRRATTSRDAKDSFKSHNMMAYSVRIHILKNVCDETRNEKLSDLLKNSKPGVNGHVYCLKY